MKYGEYSATREQADAVIVSAKSSSNMKRVGDTTVTEWAVLEALAALMLIVSTPQEIYNQTK